MTPVSPGLSTTWGAEEWSPVLIEALTLSSAVLRSGATRVIAQGRVVHLPRFKVNPAATWVAELATIPSDAGDADTLALTPRKIANLVTLSNESIVDAAVDELNAVGRGMVRGVARQVDTAFFSTASATATTPAGLLSYTLPSGTGGVTIDTLLDAIGAIESVGGNADTAFVSPADITSLRKTKATIGSYLLAPDAADLEGGGAQSIGGAKLIPTAGLTAGYAVVCESRFIQLAIRHDATVEFSLDAAFAADAVVARVTMRVDWAPGDPNAFHVIAP